MGREVRMVPADWQHPKEKWYPSFEDRYKPLHDGSRYQGDHDSFIEKLNSDGLKAAIDWCDSSPDEADCMPRWKAEERTHFMMYENTTEGTPISPAFATAEECARWCADNGASAFGTSTASYAAWLRIAKGGLAPSMVIADGVLTSGVEYLAQAAPNDPA